MSAVPRNLLALTLVLAAALAVLGVTGWQSDVRAGLAATHAPAGTPAETIEAGRKIYNFRCYYCHGYAGDARTLASTYLNPKPRDFTASSVDNLSRAHMIDAIRDGRAGTAMAGFSGILSPREIEQVANFVRDEFMVRKAANTRYHTAENGWPDHQRYRDAYAYATGDLAVDTPWEQLDARQAAGKRLYLASCVSCHDRGRAGKDSVTWELRAVSYPPNQDSCLTCHGAGGELKPSARHIAHAPHPVLKSSTHPEKHVPSASPYAIHDVPPNVSGLSPQERQGENIFKKNCAFCHAADGTGKNWIGAFLEPHPRDLTDARAMAGMTREKLVATIRDGVAGTSMPAWKSVFEDRDIHAVVAYISRVFHTVSR
jgi:cytochrome c oxidase cbb3-type subunit 3